MTWAQRRAKEERLQTAIRRNRREEIVGEREAGGSQVENSEMIYIHVYKIALKQSNVIY